jgi:hypothetical protein
MPEKPWVRPAFVAPAGSSRPPANEVARYRQQLAGAVERMEAQQSIIMAIDAQHQIAVEALDAALTEFTRLRRLLVATKPSAALTPAHERLLAACTLSVSASSLAIDAAQNGDQQKRQSAGSAAAGALMFFDYACADIGCTRPQR